MDHDIRTVHQSPANKLCNRMRKRMKERKRDRKKKKKNQLHLIDHIGVHSFGQMVLLLFLNTYFYNQKA